MVRLPQPEGQLTPLFGSNWPVCVVAGHYRAVKRALEETLLPLEPEEWEKVLGGKAIHVYRWDIAGQVMVPMVVPHEPFWPSAKSTPPQRHRLRNYSPLEAGEGSRSPCPPAPQVGVLWVAVRGQGDH
jgi:hypothetical protein